MLVREATIIKKANLWCLAVKRVLSRLVLKRKCLTMNEIVSFFHTKVNRNTDLIIMITRLILNVLTLHQLNGDKILFSY